MNKKTVIDLKPGDIVWHILETNVISRKNFVRKTKDYFMLDNNKKFSGRYVLDSNTCFTDLDNGNLYYLNQEDALSQLEDNLRCERHRIKKDIKELINSLSYYSMRLAETSIQLQQLRNGKE